MEQEKPKKPKSKAGNKESTTRQSFSFDWETVFRIIGSITGIAGVTAATLWFLGFLNQVGIQLSTGIPGAIYISFPYEYTMYQGIYNFFYFIFYTGLCLSIYYMTNIGLATLFNRINRLSTNLIITCAISLLSVIAIFYDVNYKELEKFIILLLLGTVAWAIFGEWHFNRNDDKQIKSAYYNLSMLATQILKTGMVGFAIFMLFVLQGSHSLDAGRFSGCDRVTTNLTSALIFSRNSIAIDGENKVNDSYVYKGYYLIMSDNENYYLFREVDAESLKPTRITVVKKDSITAVQYEEIQSPPNWDFSRTCSELYGN